MEKPYVAIVSLRNIEIDKSLEKGLTCQITADGKTRVSPVPFNEVYTLDIGANTKEIKVSFHQSGQEVARGDLIVPDRLSQTAEIETNERLKTSVTSNGKTQEIVADFGLTFINTKKFQPGTVTTSQAGFSSVRKRSKKASRVKARVSTRRTGSETSPLHSRAPNRPETVVKDHKYSEKELNSYLNRVVDRHLDQVKEGVQADLTQVGDSIILNKFTNMTRSELINPTLVSPQRTGVDVSRRSGTPLDRTASPEKLRQRYGSKSPSKLGQQDMTSLLMDTETRRYVNEYKNQLEYLRTIIYTLDLKLRDQETWQREVRDLRSENEKGANAREELRKTLLETTQDLKDEAQKLSKVIVEIEGHNRDILGQLRESNDQVDDLQTKLHGVEVKNAQLENENNELRAKLKAGDIYKQQLEQSRRDYLDAERRHADSLNALGEKVRHLDVALDKLNKEKKDLINENNRLNQRIAEMQQQLTLEQNNNRDIQHELDVLNQRLKVAQSAVEILQSIQEQRQAILKDLNRVRGQNDNFQKQIANLTREIIERSRDIEGMERKYKDDLLKANQRIRQLESSLSEFRNDNASLKKDGIELRNHIITLEQLLCVKEDVYSQLQDISGRLDNRNSDCDALRAQIDGSSKVIEGQEDKIYELEKCLIYLKNACAEKEEVNFLLILVCSQSQKTHFGIKRRQRCLYRNPER